MKEGEGSKEGEFRYYASEHNLTEGQYPLGYGEGYKHFENDPADLEGGANNEKRKAENAAAIDMIKARLKINMPE